MVWGINLKLNNSLKNNIWVYLIIFTLIILLFLWFFQIIFINSFYEYNKTKQIKNVASSIKENYENISINKLDNLSYEQDVCIEVVKNNNTLYSSNMFNSGCLSNSDQYKKEFSNSNSEYKTYKIVNPRFDNKILIYATKIDDNITLFIHASLEPLDTTVVILSKQLIIVSFIVIVLALIIGYFISKKISKPIENITFKAKKLASGNYDFTFDNNSNIYEIDELASTLNFAKNELEQTDQLRRDLMANVSHDLKTPLTMIKGYAEMIRDLTYNSDSKRNENLNVIIEESDRLNILVEDILTLSKLQSNKENLKIEEFDLIILIKDIVKRYSIYKDTDGYIFDLIIPNELNIKADKKRIEQVIYNLINNAINYTGKDKKISIEVIDDKDITVLIKDTGKGIKQEEIPHIWEKYYHSNKKHKRNIIGTGLGLSIVKNILESHNFEYGVESKINKGTTFYFKIKNNK